MGLELGLGEKERLGTGICIEGEKHCFPVAELLLVGDGEGEGEVRGEGNGPTPMVRGTMGSVRRRDAWVFGSLASLWLTFNIKN